MKFQLIHLHIVYTVPLFVLGYEIEQVVHTQSRITLCHQVVTVV